jgi:prepilin-type processing-associated H-X9-DG protein
MTGLMMYLLPYIEQASIYQQLTVDKTTTNIGSAWYGLNPDFGLSYTQLKTLLCPSAGMTPALVATGILVGQEGEINSGSTVDGLYYASGATYPFGLTNYAGSGGSRDNGWNGSGYDAYYQQFAGLFGNRSTNSLAKVADGTSNTLLIGESTAGWTTGTPTWGLSWMGIGVCYTKYGLDNASGSYASFGSKHINVVNFCFADGSVRVLQGAGTGLNGNSTPAGVAPTGVGGNWLLLQELAGFQDGAVVNASAIGG